MLAGMPVRLPFFSLVSACVRCLCLFLFVGLGVAASYARLAFHWLGDFGLLSPRAQMPQPPIQASDSAEVLQISLAE